MWTGATVRLGSAGLADQYETSVSTAEAAYEISVSTAEAALDQRLRHLGRRRNAA